MGVTMASSARLTNSLGRLGGYGHRLGIVRRNCAFHDAGDAELLAHDFLHDLAGCPRHGLDRQRREEPGQRATDQEADEDDGIGDERCLGLAPFRIDLAHVGDKRAEERHRR